jgi:hypothetical protein
MHAIQGQRQRHIWVTLDEALLECLEYEAVLARRNRVGHRHQEHRALNINIMLPLSGLSRLAMINSGLASRFTHDCDVLVA